MSARDLIRSLSAGVVDALRSRGRILVVKGSSAPLARELEAKMAGAIEAVAPRIERRTQLDGEVTSTFGDEAIDEIVEEVVADLTGTLMDSEHVEDVFAEDNVIERDIFRVLHDGLLGRPSEELVDGGDAGAAPGEAGRRVPHERDAILVRLDTLGYVASTIGKRAPEAALREVLERAAQSAGGELTAYDPEVREATFLLQAGGPDAGLELEEAVADELTDLVSAKVVELPSVVRRIDISRVVRPEERPALRSQINAAATRSLLQSGCAATWEFEGDRTVKVAMTPLSEPDANDIDHHVGLFARELASLLGGERGAAVDDRRSAQPKPSSAPLPPAPAGKRPAPEVASEDEDDEGTTAEGSAETVPAMEARVKKTAASSGKAAATKAPARKAASRKAPAKTAPAKKAATKGESEEPARAKAAPARKAPEKPPAKTKTR